MKDKIKIIPLGGVAEIGKNMMVYEYDEKILIVDCGVMFPDEEHPGVDLIIPDFTYLRENRDPHRRPVHHPRPRRSRRRHGLFSLGISRSQSLLLAPDSGHHDGPFARSSRSAGRRENAAGDAGRHRANRAVQGRVYARFALDSRRLRFGHHDGLSEPWCSRATSSGT